MFALPVKGKGGAFTLLRADLSAPMTKF